MSEIADIMRKDRCSWSEAKARASVPRRSSHSERSEVVVKRIVGNPAERWRSQDHTTPCMGREEPLDHALIANARAQVSSEAR